MCGKDITSNGARNVIKTRSENTSKEGLDKKIIRSESLDPKIKLDPNKDNHFLCTNCQSLRAHQNALSFNKYCLQCLISDMYISIMFMQSS